MGGRKSIMGKKKQNSVAAASKAKKDFKRRLATANVSNKISKANSKLKSTKPVVKTSKRLSTRRGEKCLRPTSILTICKVKFTARRKPQFRLRRRETRSRRCVSRETAFPTRTWKQLWRSLTTFTRWLP